MYDDHENDEIPAGKWPEKYVRLECVSVCVNYSDFLSHAALHNKNLYDRWVIVTKPTDLATIRVCKFHNLECITTNALGGPDELIKGAGINAGIEHMKPKGFCVHQDVDIIMPGHSRKVLQSIELQPENIYGIDRFNCKSAKDYFNFISQPTPWIEDDIFIHTSQFPIGTRIFKAGYGGIAIIGFWQLFHMSKFTGYNETHRSAARSDMLFSLKYPRRNRIYIPEIICLHLESQPSVMGFNWRKRQSKLFVIE